MSIQSHRNMLSAHRTLRSWRLVEQTATGGRTGRYHLLYLVRAIALHGPQVHARCFPRTEYDPGKLWSWDMVEVNAKPFLDVVTACNRLNTIYEEYKKNEGANLIKSTKVSSLGKKKYNKAPVKETVLDTCAELNKQA